MNLTSGDERRRVCSPVLKLITIIAAAVGIFLSFLGGMKSFMGGSRMLLYFTIQSNIWIALACLTGLVFMVKGCAPSRRWMVVKLVLTVSITLTGVVFCVVLAPTMGAKAWVINNVLTHVVVPVAAVADYLVVGGCVSYKKGDVLWVIVPPIYYAIFAGVGYVCNWSFAPGHNYPYFFLNWGSPAGAFGFSKELPFMGVMWWILLLLILLIACGKLYLRLVSRKQRGGKISQNAVQYDPEKQYPVIRSSICTGEKVAGFMDRESGRMTEVVCIKSDKDLEHFLTCYGLKREDVKTEY